MIMRRRRAFPMLAVVIAIAAAIALPAAQAPLAWAGAEVGFSPASVVGAAAVAHAASRAPAPAMLAPFRKSRRDKVAFFMHSS